MHPHTQSPHVKHALCKGGIHSLAGSIKAMAPSLCVREQSATPYK